MSVIKRYTRLLERREAARAELEQSHKGRETTELNYFAGYTYGQLSGQVGILEDAIDDMRDLEDEIKRLNSEISTSERDFDEYRAEIKRLTDERNTSEERDFDKYRLLKG